MIKLIIFDFDDTLVDSKKAHFHIDTTAAKKLGLKPVSEEKYAEFYGMPYDRFIKKLYPKFPTEKFMDVSKHLYDPKEFKPFPKTKDSLEYLKSKYKLAILSSKENGKLKTMLDYNELTKYFDYIHGKEDSIHFKPDPRVFDKIIAHFNLKKEEVAYVGDLASDRDAAIAADIFFVGINDCPKEGILWCDSIEGLKKIF